MSNGEPESKTPVEGLDDGVAKLASLHRGRSGTVIGSTKDIDSFMDMLYVPDIIDETAASLFDTGTPKGKLLILLGSAGDGKTAIFGRAFQNSSQPWLKQRHLNLDATASSDFGETETGDLDEFLTKVSDSLGDSGEPNRGLAINLGIAIKFFADTKKRDEYPEIWQAIKDARDTSNFTNRCLCESGTDITIANLSHRRLFDTHPDTLGQGLLSDIVSRFDHTVTGGEEQRPSPFAAISDEIREAADTHPVAYNLQRLTEPAVQDSIVRLLAARALISNEYLNPRRALIYLSHILVPDSLGSYVDGNGVPTFEELAEDDDVDLNSTLLWNSTYDVLTQQKAENARLDPCVVFSLDLDEKILELNTSSQMEIPGTNVSSPNSQEFMKTKIRMQHLRKDVEIQTEERSDTFRQFTGARTRIDRLWEPKAPNTDHSQLEEVADELIGDASELVVDAIKRWSQQSRDEDLVTIADGKPSTKYRFIAEWDDEQARPEKSVSLRKTSNETQLGKIWFAFQNDVEIPLSYELYRLLSLIVEGFNPDAVNPEESEGVRLIHSQLSQFSKKKKGLDIRDSTGQTILRVQEGTGWDEGIRISK